VVTDLAAEFSWEYFWEISHTQAEWAPSEFYHAWFVFHGGGSIVGSEAVCESMASLLKFYGRRSRTVASRSVVERVVLRVAGVAGDGTDDPFIQRCWAETGASFFCRSEKARAKRWPLGGGSKTLHRLVQKKKLASGSQLHASRFGFRRLKHLPRMSRVFVQPPSMRAWARLAKTQTAGYD
jgi:hypothetical protein